MQIQSKAIKSACITEEYDDDDFRLGFICLTLQLDWKPQHCVPQAPLRKKNVQEIPIPQQDRPLETQWKSTI